VKGDRCISCKNITSSSGGVQWEGQSATSSVMTKGSPRSSSFNWTMLQSPPLTSFGCGR
jgi:hypothetical protein